MNYQPEQTGILQSRLEVGWELGEYPEVWERCALQPGTWGYTIFVLLLGAVVGTLLGQVAASYGVKVLGQSLGNLSLAPTTLDLRAFTLTLGFSLKLNLMGLIGLLAGFVYVRRTS